MFPSSTKREIRHFHIVVVQRRLRNVQKREHDTRAKLLFCQSKPIGCRRRRRCLKGHSQLWDRGDLDTTFASLKSVYLNLKSNLRVR